MTSTGNATTHHTKISDEYDLCSMNKVVIKSLVSTTLDLELRWLFLGLRCRFEARNTTQDVWGFHSDDCEECRLLGYKNPVRISQETPYASATESSRLILCKIWGSHGSDYEECRLLGYKNPVLISQESHYASATQSSRLILCKIWGSHGGDYEECRLLGCDAMWFL
jgi:hypothetical protein